MKVLAYTSPARGHLNPMMGPLLELKVRGAEVHIRTLADAVGTVRSAGLRCEAIDPRIEALVLDDHTERSSLAAGKRTVDVWQARARYEVEDLRRAMGDVAPTLLLIDTTTFGAKAAAEASGIPWAESRPFVLDDVQPGVPVFPFGCLPARHALDRARDWMLRGMANFFDAKSRLPLVNTGRELAGLPLVRSARETRHRAPLTLYFTAHPFEYESPLPPDVRMVGAATWDPPGELPPELTTKDDRPLALVACSSEFQNDGDIAAAALLGLPPEVRVVVTSAGVDPSTLPARSGAFVTRFLPHSALLDRAAVVICHGGMGVTQKALSKGVPVCVVPWGRDQQEVAARVQTAGAGAVLPRKALSPERLAKSVESALRCTEGARRVQEGYRQTGGAVAAADALTSLVR